MNLIEKLGGYEKAKEWVNPSIEAISQEVLKSQLLEYRRQHNIFEVGDKVVWRKPLTPISSLMEITDLDGETWGIRHANDAEIAAGRRL